MPGDKWSDWFTWQEEGTDWRRPPPPPKKEAAKKEKAALAGALEHALRFARIGRHRLLA